MTLNLSKKLFLNLLLALTFAPVILFMASDAPAQPESPVQTHQKTAFLDEKEVLIIQLGRIDRGHLSWISSWLYFLRLEVFVRRPSIPLEERTQAIDYFWAESNPLHQMDDLSDEKKVIDGAEINEAIIELLENNQEVFSYTREERRAVFGLRISLFSQVIGRKIFIQDLEIPFTEKMLAYLRRAHENGYYYLDLIEDSWSEKERNHRKLNEPTGAALEIRVKVANSY